ncbi:hypothetical protein AB3662_36175 [Sorangium cellulosum]|uniref:hypothetical protein n=1 Tax=Sorangium cellulosum TaxID=56 RepID=UPI003D9A6EEB
MPGPAGKCGDCGEACFRLPPPSLSPPAGRSGSIHAVTPATPTSSGIPAPVGGPTARRG